MDPYSLEMLWPVLAVAVTVTLGVVALNIAAGQSRKWEKKRTKRWIDEATAAMNNAATGARSSAEASPPSGQQDALSNEEGTVRGKVGAWEF